MVLRGCGVEPRESRDRAAHALRLTLGQEPVPARFQGRASGFFSYFQIFPLKNSGPGPRQGRGACFGGRRGSEGDFKFEISEFKNGYTI